jgi:hypothetical protein
MKRDNRPADFNREVRRAGERRGRENLADSSPHKGDRCAGEVHALNAKTPQGAGFS